MGLQVVPIDSIAMQDTIGVSDTLAIAFWSGTLRDKPEFSHFEIVTDPAHIEITVWARVFEWVGCGHMPPTNQRVLEGDGCSIAPPHQVGHCEVVVHQPEGTVLVDTVIVKSRAAQVYFNSFESEADMRGWDTPGHYELVDDVPPVGGSRAILITGIDIVPHAYYHIGPFDEDGRYIIGCWAKAVETGSVLLRISVFEMIWFGVEGPEWTQYVSSDTLYCPAGQKITIGLTAGFGPTHSEELFVDLLEVSRVD